VRPYDHGVSPDVEQSVSASAREWISQLPPGVAPQAAALTRLLEGVEADPRMRALVVAGSVARGDADELSDLDTRLWIGNAEFDAALEDLPSLARAVGTPVDILFERPGSPFLFVQYVDGVQLELLAKRASEAQGRHHGEIVLLDRDGLLRHSVEPEPPWDVQLWSGWAWMALYDLDKYLRRGSLWEALIKLEKARSLLLRHHAAETGVPEPQFGITSILDFHVSLPERLDETVARLDAADLRRAGYACAELLSVHEPRPFGDFVLGRLANVD
jgi:predicted nucleotidyltransferase